MPRPHDFPDPRDRSINEPTVIMSNTKTIALYNQENPEDRAKNVSENVRRWVQGEAGKRGWAHVEWHGNQAVLKADLKLNGATV